MDGEGTSKIKTYRVAELWSDVWQKRKRTSLKPAVKAYLPDMAGGKCGTKITEASLLLSLLKSWGPKVVLSTPVGSRSVDSTPFVQKAEG